MFNPNSALMYCMTAIVIAFVIAMSIRFIVMAWKRAKKIGMDPKMLRRVAVSSAIFTIAPAVSILLGVIALSRALGFPLPWLRLSVIGALHYEAMAADVAAKAAGMAELSGAAMTGSVFVSIVFVMTVGIIWGGVFCVFGLKKYQSKVLNKVGQKDNRWGTILFNAMFVGMVCAFIGSAFADVRQGSVVSLIVIVVSALFMALFTWLCEKKNQKWLESFSLSFSMLLGMAAAIGAGALGIQ